MDDTQTATIVIVEDEPAIADALAARLRAEGFAVEIAHDGLRGVELCDRIAPDLVVLDVMLPGGIDGHEACRRIQRERAVPVLLLRRAQRSAEPAAKPIAAGPVTIDPERREVRRDGRLVHLTPTEFDLLHRLALRPGYAFGSPGAEAQS